MMQDASSVDRAVPGAKHGCAVLMKADDFLNGARPPGVARGQTRLCGTCESGQVGRRASAGRGPGSDLLDGVRAFLGDFFADFRTFVLFLGKAFNSEVIIAPGGGSFKVFSVNFTDS